MHFCYLVETEERPQPLDTYSGIISELIEPYYCEYDASYLSWDWCEIGGRWSGEIPNNCCRGCNIPDDFEPYGLITAWECLDQSWYDEDFWDRSAEMTQEERLEEFRVRDEEAAEKFREAFEIVPDRWYTLIDFHS